MIAAPIAGLLGLGLSAVGTGVGIMGQIGAGNAAAEAAKVQAAQARLQSEANMTQAAIDEENRQIKLKSILSTQRAIFGSSGTSLSSGSFGAIQTGDISSAARQTQQGSLIAGINSALLDTQADQYLSAGRTQRTRGLINAGTSLLDFGARNLPRITKAK